MRVLVTGAGGYRGQRLVTLVEERCDVRPMDVVDSGTRHAKVVGSVANRGAVLRAIEGVGGLARAPMASRQAGSFETLAAPCGANVKGTATGVAWRGCRALAVLLLAVAGLSGPRLAAANPLIAVALDLAGATAQSPIPPNGTAWQAVGPSFGSAFAQLAYADADRDGRISVGDKLRLAMTIGGPAPYVIWVEIDSVRPVYHLDCGGVILDPGGRPPGAGPVGDGWYKINDSTWAARVDQWTDSNLNGWLDAGDRVAIPEDCGVESVALMIEAVQATAVEPTTWGHIRHALRTLLTSCPAATPRRGRD